MNIFGERESAVRDYCRNWPTVFDRAAGCWVYDETGRAFLDFFAGAGALNYGHNNPILKQALLSYVAGDRIVHSLDMHTTAKRDFLTTFDYLILRPRQLDYRVQFSGPGGATAIEAALKLARKVTGRTDIVAFTDSFHGATLAALSVTDSSLHRAGAGIPLNHRRLLPYQAKDDPVARALSPLETSFTQICDGPGRPAAAIVEIVQGEGGIRVARCEWLRELARLCSRFGVLLIVDDIQMGCGRTGPFFSFESVGLVPDIVCLSKSIGGYGLPLALTLIRPDLDVWKPGEHNGTFRGVSAAMATGDVALRHFWSDDSFQQRTLALGGSLARSMSELADAFPSSCAAARGVGLAQGLVLRSRETADAVRAAAFERGLLVETCGRSGEVVKILPPLTIEADELRHGLNLLRKALEAVN